MPKFEHVRYKPPTELEEERPLIVACSPLRSMQTYLPFFERPDVVE